MRAAFRLPAVVALQECRDLSPEQHWRAMRGWWEQVDLLRGAEEVAYRELIAPDAWVPYPATEPVLRALRERGPRTGIVSDFARDLRTHLAHHGLDDLIDTCVISYEQGREKPDPQLFLKAGAACGLRTYILPSEHRTGGRGPADVLRLVP
ncbi:HAD family hydrolase [Streptomyces sp. AS02]|uniref:HAD family hydrolase n=1 Tax=Streptomyces sp. AS02 TaxID=2938946 RepID=UPI0020227F3F|nr:HAD family hydrolase [Streptomyces sp. AS02]MCL8010072.1 HAD hydrolase-like protein [Streptomyces sp. AS02]